MVHNALALDGMRFGRLVVVGKSGIEHGNARWDCRCDCGQQKAVLGTHLRSGKILSCGCLKKETQETHRMSYTGTYRTWKMMLQRCTNPNYTQWKDYGGRGVAVCPRWREFENFLADMGERPNDKTLDRFPDNDGNYEPENCRWATRSEQQLNRRKRADVRISD